MRSLPSLPRKLGSAAIAGMQARPVHFCTDGCATSSLFGKPDGEVMVGCRECIVSDEPVTVSGAAIISQAKKDARLEPRHYCKDTLYSNKKC